MRNEKTGTVLFQQEKPNQTNNDFTMSKTNDDDNLPLSDNELPSMKRTPQAKIIRRALQMSQQEFATQFHISIGTLRDWEQNRAQPDGAAQAYLKVIAKEPNLVRQALASS